MESIFLDNASTTPTDKEVVELMYNAMQENFGNPSSTHQFGRKAKSAIETARKNIANHLQVTASEIIFTAGGTEADNLILQNAVVNLKVTRIITSKIEHHAVLNTAKHLEQKFNIALQFVNIDKKGAIDLQHLEELLALSNKKTLVSLMYVNNEIGTILPLKRVREICKKHHALFHSDTVQAVGHFNIDLKKIPLDFMVASAHKFHGPKGVGFAYIKKGHSLKPLFLGGGQEKGARSSTENVHAILGMNKALDISLFNLEKDKAYIEGLKKYFISELKKIDTSIQFNGSSSDFSKSTYTILSVRFPLKKEMLLFNLDLQGIAVSGGSACQSGSNKGSHVLSAFLTEEEKNKTSVRFSFSKLNTLQELDFCLKKIKSIVYSF